MEANRPLQTEIPDKLYFKIGEVSRIAKVPASVLRFWETEFRRINPKRTPAGQRLYRRQDIESILLIKELLYGKKFTIKGAKRYLKALDQAGKQPQPAVVLAEIRAELERIRDLLS